MNRRSEYAENIFAVLREAGIDDYRVVNGGKHKKLKFMHQGREITYPISWSPSDRRAMLAARTQLRRILGLSRCRKKGHPKRAEKFSRPKPKLEPVPKLTSLTPGKDPWEKLRELKIGEAGR